MKKKEEAYARKKRISKHIVKRLDWTLRQDLNS